MPGETSTIAKCVVCDALKNGNDIMLILVFITVYAILPQYSGWECIKGYNRATRLQIFGSREHRPYLGCMLGRIHLTAYFKLLF